ncbi:hypothetical protein FJY63_11140, partial [Candidatus Sumerlaeota bacterium]|nr:hypothetical protein [Candidatus Sumerlaeota bacterium]
MPTLNFNASSRRSPMQIDRREFLIAATAACGTTGLAGSAASE